MWYDVYSHVNNTVEEQPDTTQDYWCNLKLVPLISNINLCQFVH